MVMVMNYLKKFQNSEERKNKLANIKQQENSERKTRQDDTVYHISMRTHVHYIKR